MLLKSSELSVRGKRVITGGYVSTFTVNRKFTFVGEMTYSDAHHHVLSPVIYLLPGYVLAAVL